MPSHIPEGYRTQSCYLIVKDAKAALAFYAKAFDAKTTLKLTMPDGSICHGEFKIGDSPIMIGEENLEWGAKSPATLGGSPVGLVVYVPDCDKVFAQAIKAGATEQKPMVDQFWGDRMGTVVDPFGHQWTIGTHQKEVSEADMQKAMDEMCKNMPQK